MEKQACNVKCVEIDGGFRIEITGIDPKDKSQACCIPVVLKCADSKGECCPPEEKKE